MKLLLILLATFFADANTQYAAGNYAEAAVLYEQAIAECPTAEAYYNLGNAHFKQGELAQSILAYERSLRLRPSYKDAKHNLQFAQSQIIDNIADNSSFFVASWFSTIRNWCSERSWFMASVALFWLFLAGILAFLFGQNAVVRKSGFYLGALCLLLSIFTGCNAASLHHRDASREEAIITQGIVNAKSSPDKSGTDLFTLHEGTKVHIGEVIGDWGEIHVGNNVGWLRLNNLERI